MARRTNARTGKAPTPTKRGASSSSVSGSKTGASLRAAKQGFQTPSAGRTSGSVGAYGQSNSSRISAPNAVTGSKVGKSLRGKGDGAAGTVGSHGQKTIKRSGAPSRLRG